MFAHVTDDFSVMNVAMNSHTMKPLLYKITGTWASHEGSMLLWVFILTGFGAAMAWTVAEMPLILRARTLAVQGMTGFGFLAFILFTSNPFVRLWPIPDEGNDLNPLLQDPGLAFHPPFLYLGYVGFSSVFSLAAALLLTNDSQRFVHYLRPWALAAWGALTFGIAMGSWWAYYELGWGGYWFWDPVENAALMPWLAGTALLHSLVASSQRAALMRWTILLSILAFSLSLLGTFLVRSGVLTSVHSFAVDPERGVFVLALLALAVGGALMLYASRASSLPESPLFEPVSREAALLINNLFLCTACATLVTGTLYPILLNALTGNIVSVGAPYFNATVLPLLMPAAMLMVVGPLLTWRQDDLRPLLRQLAFAFVLALCGAALGLYLYGYHGAFGLLGFALGLWVLGGVAADARRFTHNIAPHLPRLLAHGGLGLAILGMGGSIFSEMHTLQMHLHDVAMIGDTRIEFAGITEADGPNYEAARGTFFVTRHGHALTLEPEQRLYPTQGMPLSHVAIATNLLADTYLALGPEEEEADGSKSRSVRFEINPLAPWIWIGGAVMALGGLWGAVQKRHAQ
jgi:cytochrome c-type biogenesis protein CcmF